MTTTSEHETPNPIGLELTHDQGYALAAVLARLTGDELRKFVSDDDEYRHALYALRELEEGLQHAGYYPPEGMESAGA